MRLGAGGAGLSCKPRKSRIEAAWGPSGELASFLLVLPDWASPGIIELPPGGIVRGVPSPLDRGVQDPGGPNTPGVNALPKPLGGSVNDPERSRAAATGSGDTGCDSRRIDESTAVLPVVPALAPATGGVIDPVLLLPLLLLFSGNPDRRLRKRSGRVLSPPARLGESRLSLAKGESFMR